MSKFPTTKNEIIRHTIENEEGGWKYTDHPDDPDQGTYAGVRYQTFMNYIRKYHRTDLVLTAEEFKDYAEINHPGLQDAIVDVYEDMFYSPLRLDELPDYLRCMLFSIGVNLGIDDAGKILQHVINQERPKESDHIVVDGKVGPKTLAAANMFLVFNLELIRLRVKHRIFYLWQTEYNTLVVNNAKTWRAYALLAASGAKIENKPEILRATFLQGWFNRAVKYIQPE